MTAWKLPTSLNIGGVVFRIRTDFRDILKIMKAFNDPDLKDWMKIQCMIVLFNFVLYKKKMCFLLEKLIHRSRA